MGGKDDLVEGTAVAAGSGGSGWSRVGQDELGLADLCRTSGARRAPGNCVSFPACLFIGFVYSSPGRTEVWAGVVRDPPGG